MTAEETRMTRAPKAHKTLLLVVLIFLLGLSFKALRFPSADVRSDDERYPSLYCKFHDCATCSDQRIIVNEKTPMVVFDLRRTCIQWVVMPPKHFRFDNDLSSVDLGIVVQYAGGKGTQKIAIL